jgi:hypothetical protein
MIVVRLWHQPQRRQPIRDRESVLLVRGADELIACVVFEAGEECGGVESWKVVEVVGY